MKIKIFLLLLLPCLGTFALQAQSTRLLIKGTPASAIVRVDSQKISADGANLNLSTGKHRIRAWEANYQLLDTLITLEEGETKLFSFRLRLTSDYIKYQKQLKVYKAPKQRALAAAISIPVVAFPVVLGTRSYNRRMDEQWALAEAEKETYGNTIDPSSLALAREKYYEHAEEYDRNFKRRNLLLIAYGTYCGAASVYIWRKLRAYRKSSMPVPPTQPKLLSHLDLGFGHSQNHLQALIQFNF